jgi:predicted RNA-binding Zn ribbon-like protein
MEKSRSVETLQVIGGHPSLDFANTVSSRRDRAGIDVLATYGDLLDWGLRAGVLDAAGVARLREVTEPRRANVALARAKRLREAIYRVFSAVAAGEEPPRSDFERLQREAGRGAAARQLVRTAGGFAWHWRHADNPDFVTLLLAHEAAELLVDPRRVRVKECFGRNCGWLFLDTSRNGLRRWCSEEDCGSLDRVTRHRARKRLLACEAASSRSLLVNRIVRGS